MILKGSSVKTFVLDFFLQKLFYFPAIHRTSLYAKAIKYPTVPLPGEYFQTVDSFVKAYSLYIMKSAL